MATVLALGGDEVSLFHLQDVLESFGHVLAPTTETLVDNPYENGRILRLLEGQQA